MKIAVYAFNGVSMFHLSVPHLVFDEVTRSRAAEWKTWLFSERSGSIRTAEGYTMGGVQGLRSAEDADLIVIPSWLQDGIPPGRALLKILRHRHASGVPIVGLCLGANALADAGFLAGRTAVTHWKSTEELASRHPEISVQPSALYLDHGDVMTSAGTASGIDACLHIVRTRLGSAVANQVARHLVVAPHREGGQAQYIARPVAVKSADGAIAVACSFALEHLAEELDVARLADAAHMSQRSFVRAFRDSTGATPAAWVRSRRLDEARTLLETSDLPIDQIAAATGFGSPVTFRQNFMSAFGSTPSSYRRRFDAR
ncbi:AraC family transcriptional regulator [Pseudoclavibacter sp. RFBJ3]|uniref:GlxA family transcriptional regulator n=1 Tax=unclassified Pseudoclavibacter TaxID=2615177 RepID=UPI000CE89F04|nr:MULTISPECIES: helix-turn-helix domain-containing protein [unclassified Pseudoclavibacter]PPF87518.1 AraC family transcriptional regulator [Pseudoclavibacter sp. RFBJ5]PPF90368.1 AraC family transcriptional regulator [Pseudoclavibacter sp. RFBJ3]PPG01053.1 AraC family transcriptional regulator [Pseudoclavibacter sp. RFBH5]PPG26156.1 AraC family transcriptional regulator [Pseudoclavibacter sp. RFBI4]